MRLASCMALAHCTQIGFYTDTFICSVHGFFFVNISSSSAMHQKSLCQRSDNCPKYYYYYLSCQCAAAQSLNVIHGIVCPRPVPGSCLHPSLILVTVFNGTPSVMKKWWMFSENYWSDRHNWPFRRDNQIESLVPLTAGAHNSCFSWAIR